MPATDDVRDAVKTPIAITSGWLDGHMIRRARKKRHCEYWRGLSNGAACNKPIDPGDLYAEGELDQNRGGGFRHHPYCLECAGEDARAALALATTPTTGDEQ